MDFSAIAAPCNIAPVHISIKPITRLSVAHMANNFLCVILPPPFFQLRPFIISSFRKRSHTTLKLVYIYHERIIARTVLRGQRADQQEQNVLLCTAALLPRTGA